VTPPFLNLTGFTSFVGAGLHRDFTVFFSDPVPAGGITVNFSSTDPAIVSVVSSVSVLAGATSATVQVSGVRPGIVDIAASSLGWTGDVEHVTAAKPTFRFVYSDCCFDLPTSRTTASPPHALSVSTVTPGCGTECDSANTDITVSFAVTGTPTNIVTITPASLTLHQNRSRSDDTSVGTPSSVGTYTITASATGFDSLTSGTVTVSP
jgi:hypothetical protein